MTGQKNQTSYSAKRSVSQRRLRTLVGLGMIELLWCMMILGIVAAAAIPRIVQSIAAYRADATARRIVIDLEQTRLNARKLGTNQTITFDPALHSYTLPGQRELDRNSGTYTVKLREEPYIATLVSVVFDSDGSNNAEDQSLVFDRFGIPDSGGTVRVTVGGVTKDISVNALTGQAVLP